MNAQNNTMAELTVPRLVEDPHTSTPSLRLRRLRINGLRLLVLALIFGGWELTTRLGIVDPFFWGQPSGIVAQIITWVTQGTAQGPLWEQITATLEEAVIGFVIGVVLGVLFGIVLGRNQFLSDVLGPFIKAGNSIPRIVLGSIFVIALGYEIQSKVALAMVMVFFIVFFNAFQGVREVDRSLLANARILGASQRRLSTAVILPSALSWIIASLHTSFSFALVGAVVGEYLGATAGLGLMVQNAQGIFNSNGVFAVMAILTAIALSAEALITALEHRLIRWRPAIVNDVPL
jgi:NitT/TauT family transport system permease protein